jgi:hypothetical protein
MAALIQSLLVFLPGNGRFRFHFHLYHLIPAGSLLITATPALLTISSWESMPPEVPIAPLRAIAGSNINSQQRRSLFGRAHLCRILE